MAHKILIIDDDKVMRTALNATLQSNTKFDVDVTEFPAEGISLIKEKIYDVVITDLMMPEIDGLKVLEEIQRISPDTAVILITAFGTVETAVAAMKKGAYDYLTKPFSFDELQVILAKAIERQQLISENKRLKKEIEHQYGFDNIVGKSKPMQNVYEMIRKVSETDSTILITGESGTGKELVARAIHYHSIRKDKPFIAVNCAALPETLLESELFGHVKGSFTGAVNERRGRFELAEGGTLFLDEIGELPRSTQAKLLRTLQEKTFEKVGGEITHHCDVRLITATNRDLEEMMEKNDFREDLYYRLNIIPFNLPPLREREEDIPLLINHFLGYFCTKFQKDMKCFTSESTSLLLQYDWPGNIRELQNIVERCVVLCSEKEIGPVFLPPKISKGAAPGKVLLPEIIDGEFSSLKEMEKQYIIQILNSVDGNYTLASRILEIDRKTLYNKLKAYQIARESEDEKIGITT